MKDDFIRAFRGLACAFLGGFLGYVIVSILVRDEVQEKLKTAGRAVITQIKKLDHHDIK